MSSPQLDNPTRRCPERWPACRAAPEAWHPTTDRFSVRTRASVHSVAHRVLTTRPSLARREAQSRPADRRAGRGGSGLTSNAAGCRTDLVRTRRRRSSRADLARLVFDEMTPLYHRLTTSIFYNDSTLLDNGIIITAADEAASAARRRRCATEAVRARANRRCVTWSRPEPLCGPT